VKDVYLLVKALVPDDVNLAEVRDAALEALNIPPDCNPGLDWTWDVAISERGADPETEAVLGERSRDWRELRVHLMELEAAGALNGVRVVVAERVRQVREDATAGSDRGLTHGELLAYAHRRLHLGKYRQAAALLAAEIDRAGTP
jgi:hypothetical protein